MRGALCILRANGAVCLIFCSTFFPGFFSCNYDAKNVTFSQVNNSEKNETLYYLDVKNSAVSQPVDRDLSDLQNYKFLEVEVAKVVNPNMHPVIFEVYYESGEGEKTFLGTFSLYPSDNPGKFIVPTKTKVRNDGRLILSLVLPKNIRDDDKLRVAVKKIQFKKD